jgi:hypothetical protein
MGWVFGHGSQAVGGWCREACLSGSSKKARGRTWAGRVLRTILKAPFESGGFGKSRDWCILICRLPTGTQHVRLSPDRRTTEAATDVRQRLRQTYDRGCDRRTTEAATDARQTYDRGNSADATGNAPKTSQFHHLSCTRECAFK